MSTLTQFLPQGDSFLGEFIPGVTTVWGDNPVFGGKEFLRTGITKSYVSDYAVLANNFPQAVINSELGTSSSSWSMNLGGVGSVRFFPEAFALYFVGSNYHQIVLGNSQSQTNGNSPVKYGTDITSTATNGPTPFANGEEGYTDAAVVFSNAILLTSRNATTSAFKLWRSTGTTYTDTYTLPNAGSWTLAASPSLVIGFSSANANTTTLGSVITSTNGTTWTSTNTTANITPTTNERHARLTYSSAGSNFILVTTLGNIFTSTDGTTWTSRTAPSGMPASVAYVRGNNVDRCANSSTATMISLGSGKLLRTTDGTSFTLIDIGTDPAVSAWFPTTSNAGIAYNGTNFIIFISATTSFGYSADDGASFLIDYAKLTKSNNVGAGGTISVGPQYANSKIWYFIYTNGGGGGIIASTAYDLGSRVARSTPQSVGIPTAVTWVGGLSTFLRIK